MLADLRVIFVGYIHIAVIFFGVMAYCFCYFGFSAEIQIGGARTD